MAHGAGGVIMQGLVKDSILKYLAGAKAEVSLEALDDSGVIEDIVLSTDCHTVKPLFFPGGDIGGLSVAGTVNDVAVMGASPIALTSGFVIEEGFPMRDFERIVKSMSNVCKKAGVYVIAGDTKVVEKGALDKFIINTSGIGKRSKYLESNISEVKKYRKFKSRWLLDSNVRKGDKIIISGSLGDHGIAVISKREGYGFGSSIVSDVAPMNRVVERLLKVGGIVAMKDPTRGGLSNALNEWSEKGEVGILVYEEKIPIKEGVKAACEMLGIDPLEIGNEGKLLIAVVPQKAKAVLSTLRKTKEGKEAQIIGEATSDFRDVILKTSVGGKRILPSPSSDPIPRIC
jgi:hydrogenase expression/formation protein HypE